MHGIIYFNFKRVNAHVKFSIMFAAIWDLAGAIHCMAHAWHMRTNHRRWSHPGQSDWPLSGGKQWRNELVDKGQMRVIETSGNGRLSNATSTMLHYYSVPLFLLLIFSQPLTHLSNSWLGHLFQNLGYIHNWTILQYFYTWHLLLTGKPFSLCIRRYLETTRAY